MYILSYTAFDSNPGLFVQAIVYDMTSGSPVLVGKFPLSQVAGGTYSYNFLPKVGHSYLANVSVFTTNLYTTLNSNYSQSDIQIQPNGLLSFTAFDGATGLFIQALVYDSSLNLVGTYDLINLWGGTYYSTAFVPTAVKSYIASISAFTDGTYTVLNSNYTPSDQEITGAFSTDAIVTPSADGAVDAAIDGLVAYLQGISGLTVLTEWPVASQKIAYPTCTITTGMPKRMPIQPEQIAITSPNGSHQVTETIVVSQYDIPMQIDLWARTKLERRQFLNAILQLMNAAENTGDAPSGLSLQLTNYYNIFARYEIDTHEFRDDEIAAERQERRCRISLLVNTREIVQRTRYAIVHATMYDEVDTLGNLTDDTANTETKAFF